MLQHLDRYFFLNNSAFQIFRIEKYNKSLEKIAADKGIEILTRSNLVEVDGTNKIAKFEKINENCEATGEVFDIKVT